MTAVMVCSLALPQKNHGSFWDSSRVSLQRFCLRRYKTTGLITMTSRNQSTLFISSKSKLVFLTCSILTAESLPLVCVVSVFRQKLSKRILYFSRRASFCDAGHSVHFFGSLIKRNCFLHKTKQLSTLGNNFVTKSMFGKRL